MLFPVVSDVQKRSGLDAATSVFAANATRLADLALCIAR